MHFLPQKNLTAAKKNDLYAKNDTITRIKASRC